MYAYIETSSPRQPGDTARLESPWIRGPQCMTFFYHMHGSPMSCVVIYIKSQAANRLRPVWLRSQDQGNQWIQGKISISETSSYQVSCKVFSTEKIGPRCVHVWLTSPFLTYNWNPVVFFWI